MRIPRSLTPVCCVALLVVGACDEDNTAGPGGGPPPPSGDYTYDLVDAFPNLTFNHPVDIRNAGDGSDRLFVVEQEGVIRVFANADTVSSSTVYLDISATVASGGELGLLGLAFHPGYASNGYFFVYYTIGSSGNRHARLCRFQVSADPDVADPSSETLLIDIPEPFDNHNGGGMCFDGDGYLCVGIGDGGDQGDPNSNGQNPLNLLGTVVRIDVDQNVNVDPYYGIPPDNPFAGGSLGRHEVFAYGFRNPWRVSWDAAGGKLWVGDVGQGAYEEIDHVSNGGNYGWDCREGLHPYTGPGSPAASCTSASGLIDPIFEYSHSIGQSITGGYVYRGPTLTSLSGRYVFADYVQGRVWALTTTTPLQAEPLRDVPDYVSTFGVDEAGELLVATYSTSGKIYHITQTEKNR